MTTAKKKAPAKKGRVKRVRMQAVQALEHRNVYIAEGVVFDFIGEELPAEHIAVRVEPDRPLGPQPVQQLDPLLLVPQMVATGDDVHAGAVDFLGRARADA